MKNHLILLFVIFSVLPTYKSLHASDDTPASAATATGLRVCSCADHDCDLARTDIPKGRGSSGRWKDAHTPKRGWVCVDIEDHEEGSQNHVLCGMCEREEIRWGHIMHHTGFPEDLEVGCICAGYMEGSLNPRSPAAPGKKRENYIKKRAAWLKKLRDPSYWKVSRAGKDYFPLRCRSLRSVDIYVNEGKFSKFGASIRDIGRRTFTNIGWYNNRAEAAKHAFDEVFPQLIKPRGYWKPIAKSH
ncbi:MAG: hypothetical protein H6849_02210 [Alphaproteobacteria bacterium]|nr:MAG: hypothetical protein H6849_02210 [Alphaproteobacteria bacterium]